MSGFRSHRDLPVYQDSFQNAREIFQLSKKFPREELYSLTDQIRRSSRSVCANVGEAWRKRRYERLFVSTLNIAEAEAAETQVWLEFALNCEYIPSDQFAELFDAYEHVISQLVYLIHNPTRWILK